MAGSPPPLPELCNATTHRLCLVHATADARLRSPDRAALLRSHHTGSIGRSVTPLYSLLASSRESLRLKGRASSLVSHLHVGADGNLQVPSFTRGALSNGRSTWRSPDLVV